MRVKLPFFEVEISDEDRNILLKNKPEEITDEEYLFTLPGKIVKKFVELIKGYLMMNIVEIYFLFVIALSTGILVIENYFMDSLGWILLIFYILLKILIILFPVLLLWIIG